jgi:16S rRNA (guanine527-N7)-methyltransferase
MIRTEAEARELVAQLGDPGAIGRCEHLLALLTDENTRQNLVSSASLGEAWVRHIADSAQLLKDVPRETFGPWLDLGTGAGFPGLVVAALRPNLPVIMVESRARRVEWLQRAAQELGLEHARIVGARLELVESFPARVISARAFAPLDRLLEISARFSTDDTLWLLPKGRSAWDEVNRLSGWQHMFHVEQSLTDPDAGVVVGTVSGPLAAVAKPRGKKARST